MGHSWTDFWFGVAQNVVGFVVTGALAFVTVRKLKLSDRAMAVTGDDLK